MKEKIYFANKNPSFKYIIVTYLQLINTSALILFKFSFNTSQFITHKKYTFQIFS